jgi:hypothetical protein
MLRRRVCQSQSDCLWEGEGERSVGAWEPVGGNGLTENGLNYNGKGFDLGEVTSDAGLV